MKVLVAATCAPDDRKTLCAVRSLASAGFDVTVAGDRLVGRAFASRYGRDKLRYPHPERDPDGFLDTLACALQHAGHSVILPTSEYVVAALVDRHDAIGRLAKLAVPPAEAAACFRDKLETLDLARRLGLETPTTHCPHSADELEDLVRFMDRPFVVKPRRSTGGIGFARVTASDGLPEWTLSCGYADTVFDFTRPLVQQYIDGDVHDVCTLFNRGEPRAVLTQRRLKMFPAAGGAGILNETTDEPDLVERAVSLLGSVGWHGPAQVEFRRASDGTPHLMEVNGRLWGTLDLAVAAGIDFPALTCRLAVDGDVPPVDRYTVGLRFRWPVPFGVLHAAETGRWCGALWEFYGPKWGVRSDVWLSDPLPWVAEVVLGLRGRCPRREDGDEASRRLRRLTDFGRSKP